MTTILRTIPELQHYLKGKKKIGFVPTMGALHAGHLSLITSAKQQCDTVIASIFVNPAQFAPHEDFDRYPRQHEKDTELLESAGAHAVFIPNMAEIYPSGFKTTVPVGSLGDILEGQARPGFFNGVALVVKRLLLLVQPDIAVFGEKDYQQLLVVRQLVNNLNIPTIIIAAPIVRETDGLAMSSRNVYLTPEQRTIAPHLYRTLEMLQAQLQQNKPIQDLQEQARAALLEAGFTQVDYITVCDGLTLEPLSSLTPQARILAAVHLGTVRLIDNLAVFSERTIKPLCPIL
jgi:pantoate--beta-alanine ligase